MAPLGPLLLAAAAVAAGAHRVKTAQEQQEPSALALNSQSVTRCGRDWGDANGRCGTPCSGTDAGCPAGERCFADLKPCSGTGSGSSTRCGTSWGDANSNCGTVCWGTDAPCPAGQRCFADLGPCGGPTPTPSPTPPPFGGGSCVAQRVLQCVNDQSSYWPRCSPAQSKSVVGPSGYQFGYYCTQEWADALNAMLSDPQVNKCGDQAAINKLLGQITYETADFSTVYQPLDGGAGLIHMIPANWAVNAADMDTMWPGNDYVGKVRSMGASFFQTPAYGWRSVAAWYKRTNRVIAGCGVDLFDASYDRQTQCIFGRVMDRSQTFNFVAGCLR